MGEPGPLGDRLSCTCQACLVWRRLGEELHLGHQTPKFLEDAGRLLREVFDLILARREALRLDIWRPLAGGEPGGDKEVPEEKDKESKPRRRKRRRSHTSRDQSSEVEDKRSRERSTGKEKNKRSRSRRRRKTPGSGASPVRPRVSTLVEEKTEVEEVRQRYQKEPSERKGEVSPEKRQAVTASSGKPSSSLRPPPSLSSSPTTRERKPPAEKKRSREESRRSPSEEGSERPPGQWTLRERPREPSRPPSQARPPEPPGPPPGWKGPIKAVQRSKGVVRRERQADIFLHGPSAARKKEREERRRG